MEPAKSTVGKIIAFLGPDTVDVRDYFDTAPRGGFVFRPFQQFITSNEFARIIAAFTLQGEST